MQSFYKQHLQRDDPSLKYQDWGVWEVCLTIISMLRKEKKCKVKIRVKSFSKYKVKSPIEICP